MQKLDLYRNEIDKIDENILKLLNQRAEIVLNIGKVKKEKKARFFVPGREREIFARLNRMHQGAFPKDALRTIFREILSASLSLESPIRVAYLGPEATFSHLASLREFGSSSDLVPALSIRDIFEGLECRRTDYGVVPIENSNEGVVGQTLDLFVASPVQIVGEVIQEISHFLLSKSGRMKGIRKIYSHPQAISQCRLWIESHLKGVELVEVFSTTQAAERSKKDAKSAAIASELAGRLYGLRVVEPHIEDHANNVTRFLVISLKGLQKTGKDKTSILFSVKDRVGALNGVLKPFAQHRINLSRIESRPSKKKPWEYIFYVDLEGHQSDLPVKRALKALDAQCNFLKILGSYPKSSGES